MKRVYTSRFEKEKVFCVGLWKTGTTSLEGALSEVGYKTGEQKAGELLINEWARRDFRHIVRLACTADAFQDTPFCLPYTYQVLDQRFSNAKFILTVRDSSEAWYNSLVGYHSKLWGNGTNAPTADDLKSAFYLKKGYVYESLKLAYGTDDEDLYNKESMQRYYNCHVSNVQDYFRFKKNKLITINIANGEDYFRMCEFLNKSPVRDSFPWLNQT